MDLPRPTGDWAPPYAERLALVEGFPAPALDHTDPAAEAALAAWQAPLGEPERADVVVEDLRLPGPRGSIPVRLYRAPGDLSGIGLVWFHGGAFITGDLEMPEADLVALGLADRTAGVVISVDYRLCVDGAHHPVPHDDAYAAYRWFVDHAAELGVGAARIAVGGASAGGCLAATVALHARDEQVPPAGVLLAYPVLHGLMPAPSAELASVAERIPALLRFPPALTTALNWNYVGGDPATADPHAFAGHASDLTGFPPTYIENCEFDDLRASGERFGEQLTSAGVVVEVATTPGVAHGHLNAIGSPFAAATLDRFAAHLQDWLR